MVLTPGHRVWLRNDTDAEKTLSAHSQLAGYFKGQFKQSPDEPSEQDLLFDLSDAHSEVVFGNKVLTLKELMEEKRKVSPLTAVVCYHDLVDAPTAEDSKFFRLTKKYNIAFAPEATPPPKEEASEDEKKTLPWSSLAGMLSPQHWRTQFTTILWQVKWVAKGLQPIRPVVVLKQAVTVPPGTACELTQTAAA